VYPEIFLRITKTKNSVHYYYTRDQADKLGLFCFMASRVTKLLLFTAQVTDIINKEVVYALSFRVLIQY